MQQANEDVSSLARALVQASPEGTAVCKTHIVMNSSTRTWKVLQVGLHSDCRQTEVRVAREVGGASSSGELYSAAMRWAHEHARGAGVRVSEDSTA